MVWRWGSVEGDYIPIATLSPLTDQKLFVSVLTFFTLKRVLVALAPPGGLPIASHF